MEGYLGGSVMIPILEKLIGDSGDPVIIPILERFIRAAPLGNDLVVRCWQNCDSKVLSSLARNPLFKIQDARWDLEAWAEPCAKGLIWVSTEAEA